MEEEGGEVQVLWRESSNNSGSVEFRLDTSSATEKVVLLDPSPRQHITETSKLTAQCSHSWAAAELCPPGLPSTSGGFSQQYQQSGHRAPCHHSRRCLKISGPTVSKPHLRPDPVLQHHLGRILHNQPDRGPDRTSKAQVQETWRTRRWP